MSPRPVLLGVAALVVLAGCGGLGDGGSDAAPDVDVVYSDDVGPPATTPNRETYARDPFPPGTSADGVDADALSRIHEKRLSETSWTLAVTTRAVAPDGTAVARSRTRIRQNGTRWIATTVTRGSETALVGADPGTYAIWTNGTRSATRGRFPNGTVRYSAWAGRPPLGLRSFDRTGAVAVAERTTPIDLAYRGVDGGLLVFRGDRARLDRPHGPTARNLSLTLRVTPAGVVRSFTYRYAVVRDGERVTVVERFEVAGVGTTTVEVPEWYPDAVANDSDGRD